ncbi:MAG: sulfatase-like hydrolase/transferase [Lachnospiraceae bacterium]|nr:sulfatase-like hydrolase/transferase [Lachnospiraceae bacterium]
MSDKVPFAAFQSSVNQTECSVDMSEIVGTCDILFVCLDTLRYDAAIAEEESGGTPVLNRYGAWEKRHAPGNFTYPSHHAIFAGFLPSKAKAESIAGQEKLFFPKDIGMGRKIPKGGYGFETDNLVEGLHKDGYDTWCIGGVAFFDKRSALGNVFPSFFEKSCWNPSFSPMAKESAKNQVDFIIKKLEQNTDNRKIFLYLNISCIHYPNYFYLDRKSPSGDPLIPAGTRMISGSKNGNYDSLESHRAALRYADGQLGRLFEFWKSKRGKTFVICFSDHGTCYGEDGYVFHRVNHPVVGTVPYKHFFL